MSQVVDTLTAKDLMEEALRKISEAELQSLASKLEKKSSRFQTALHRESIAVLEHQSMRNMLHEVFSTKRKADSILEKYPAQVLTTLIRSLLYGSESLEYRFDRFCSSLPLLDENVRFDFASELLHFTQPEKYWLWTMWMWNPKSKTGSLPLVIVNDFPLQMPTAGATYLRVGEAVAFVNNVGRAAGFQRIGRGLFGTDVYLACVYGIYIYTVLKMRMTQEFNKVIPQLPELSARLLGIHQEQRERTA